MKAIAAHYAVPDAAVLAIEAGCDGVLICSGDDELQAAALEALVNAVEAGTLPLSASRTRSAAAARQGAVPRGRAAARPAGDAGPAAGARPRRAPPIADEMARSCEQRSGRVHLDAPPRLLPGDRLALVAPASPFKREEFDARRRGDLRASASSRSTTSACSRASGYVAGRPDAARRGASRTPGAIRRSPAIDRRARRLRQRAAAAAARPRGRCASARSRSSATATSRRCSPFYLQRGLVAFHGPMLAGRLAAGQRRLRRRRRSLGALCQRGADGRAGAGGPRGRSRRARRSGILCGGTLTQLLASLGTPFAFAPPAGYVLFLDEVGERPYRLDRMVTQLRQAGLLARARGGRHRRAARCDEPGGEPCRPRVVTAISSPTFPGPVLIGFPSGHTVGPALTLPFGVRARVVDGARPAPRHRRAGRRNDATHPPDRHLRHRDGHAGGDAEAQGPRRPAAPTRTSIRR